MRYFRLLLPIVLISFLFITASANAQYYSDPGYSDLGYSDPGYSDPGYNDSSYTDPGYTNPGGTPGCVGGCTVFGYVFEDTNQNGSYNPGDHGLPDQTVELRYSNGSFNDLGFATSRVTDSTGRYSIAGVPQGQYYLVRNSTLPSGWNRTYPAGGQYGWLASSNLQLDFGVYNPASNTPSPPPPSPIANNPPGAFGHNPSSQGCPSGTSTINLSWSAAPGATSYTLYYMDSSVGTAQPPSGIIVGNTTTYQFTATQGLIPGRWYGFAVYATNDYGSTLSNQAPYSPTSPGGWSHQIFGWFQAPDCSIPGPFTFTYPPVSSCRGWEDAVIDVHWTASYGATSFLVFPQKNPGLYYYPSGLAPTAWGAGGGNLVHTLNPYNAQPNGQWEYNIYASNSNGGRWVSGGSSYYHYGWTNAVNCSNPNVDLKIDITDTVKTINSGATVQLNYSINNAYRCSTYANPVTPPLTTPWTNLYPPPTNNPYPWATNGAINVTLYNNTTYPNNSYQFTLACDNNYLPGPPVSQQTVTVNVLPVLAPFIQTTQGDVHSNEDINVP